MTRRRLGELASALLVLASGVVVMVGSARPPQPPPAVLSASAGIGSFPPPVMTASETEAPSVTAEPGEAKCSIPKQGRGRYGEPTSLTTGRLRVPEPPPTEGYRLLLHLHGGRAAERVLAPADLGVVMVTVDAGVGSKAYAEAFATAETLETILAEVDDALGSAQLEDLIVSSWSAGYGGVRQILQQHPASVSALVLLDSVHASYTPDGEPEAAALDPFASYARSAVDERAVMVLTHSEIRPPGYASTSEVADRLLDAVGGQRRYGGLVPQFGVDLKTTYEEGEFVVRGFTGTDKGAHCAHLRMLAGILERDVLPALDG